MMIAGIFALTFFFQIFATAHIGENGFNSELAEPLQPKQPKLPKNGLFSSLSKQFLMFSS